ncbi:MAG: cytochrome c oxidase assembly protein [Rhizobiales bacterium]|jgi:cytochrome c oxidase assembly protein subunit 11|nr:cytochrome c oxidase assembly protein [Hyphomicrobiales bacterium]
MNTQPTPPLQRRDKIVAVSCGLFVAAMVGAAYAAVPFYNWFCRATGYNGTTQVATSGPSGMIDRKVTIRFDANVGPGLPWSFVPEQNSIEVKLGQVVTVHYRVVNQAARPITASAAYNVTPLSVGSYFNKINCFCFTEQSLKAGEKRELAVVFYVDPAMAKDSDGANVNTITLSYTFYQQREPYRPVADSTLPEKRGQI